MRNCGSRSEAAEEEKEEEGKKLCPFTVLAEFKAVGRGRSKERGILPVCGVPLNFAHFCLARDFKQVKKVSSQPSLGLGRQVGVNFIGCKLRIY